MGKDMYHSPVVSPTMADQVAPSSDMLKASFDTLQGVLVHLVPSVRQEQDLTSSEFISGRIFP